VCGVNTDPLCTSSNQYNIDTLNNKCPMSKDMDRFKCRVGFKHYDEYFRLVNTATLSNGVCTENICAYCDCEEDDVTPGFIGMTGRECDIEFTRCPDGVQVCFNGAPCVEVNHKYVCSCPYTTDPVLTYAGEHCEYVASDFCAMSTSYDVSESGRWFCTNNGNCRNGATNPEDICRCKEGYYGLHCEFKEEKPVCDIKCENDGICNTGIKDYSNYDVTLANFLKHGDEETSSYCVCPDGWTGLTCQYRVEECGSSVCLNGASCKSGMGGYYCDCSDVDLTNSDGNVIPYAGTSCERVYTTMCGFDNTGYFCTNGGSCPAELHLPCECPEDFHGPKCEFEGGARKSTCTLGCKNDGVCHFGDGPEITIYDNLNLTMPDIRIGMHCLCPTGYAGYFCENAIDICGNFEHHCQNKGKCVMEGSEYKCDCNTDSSDTPYAGVHCEHRATTFCVRPGASTEFLCTNEGECKEILVPGVKTHPGCICNPEHTGKYCDLNVTKNQGQGIIYEVNTLTKIFLGITIVLTLFGVSIFLTMFIRMKLADSPDRVYTTPDELPPGGVPPEVHIHALNLDNDHDNTLYMGTGYEEEEEEAIDFDKVIC